MARRLPASMRTRQNLSELIEGRLSSSAGRSELVELAARLILEEALEEESRDALGRDYYERGGDADRGYRNGVREGRLKTAEGMIPFSAPPPRKAGFAGAPSQRSPTARSPFGPRTASISRGAPRHWRTWPSSSWRAACRCGTSRTPSRTRAAGCYCRRRQSRRSARGCGPTIKNSAGAISASTRSSTSSSTALQSASVRGRSASRCWPPGALLPTARRFSWACLQGLLALSPSEIGSKASWPSMAGSKEDAETVVAFFQDLRARGLGDPLLVVSDGAPGIIKAIETCFPRSARQRCLAHRMRNLAAKVPEDQWPDFKARVQAAYQAPSRAIARDLAEGVVNDHEAELPSAVACFRDDLEACIAHLRLPITHRRAIRTTDEMDKRFRRRGVTISTAWATSWRSAAHRLEAPPGRLIRALPV